MAKTKKKKGWTITLRKCRSTWYWFVGNPQGGGGGSNMVSSKKVVLAVALRNVPKGTVAKVVTKDCYSRRIIKTESIKA